MPAYTGKPKNFQQYTKMLEEAHTSLSMVEKHLKELVNTQKMADSRIYEDQHRIVQPEIIQLQVGGTNVTALTYPMPQGEAWSVERFTAVSADTTVTNFLAYRDNIIPARLAEVAYVQPVEEDGACMFAGSFSNRLYMPERTTLIVVAATATGLSANANIDGNIQVRVLKRHSRKITTEHAYALAGDYDEREEPPGGIEDDYTGDAPLEPHDERHGDIENTSGMLDTDQDDNQWTGDIAPPSAEQLPRPKPSWPQRIEHAIETFVEETEEAIEKVV